MHVLVDGEDMAPAATGIAKVDPRPSVGLEEDRGSPLIPNLGLCAPRVCGLCWIYMGQSGVSLLSAPPVWMSQKALSLLPPARTPAARARRMTKARSMAWK